MAKRRTKRKMRKRRTYKKKINYKIVFIILAIIILAILLLTFIFKQSCTTCEYRIELYLKKPSGEEIKIRECNSNMANFECVQTCAECSEPGEYYSKAITYYGGIVLSESKWQLAYNCFIEGASKKIEQTSEALAIRIESPLNQTYYTENVILKVAASETAKWIADSIDGSENLTACYNCDSYSVYYLKFSKGVHTVNAYASDYDDKISQASAVFFVN